MTQHEFIFTPGTWIGEGKISFSASPEFIKFYTKWQITKEEGHIKAVQAVEMQGVDEHVVNVFYVIPDQEAFKIQLENEMIGKVSGTGLTTEKTIAWEFREQFDFEGFESYELQENGDYFLHAEYASPDQFRTIVEGLIWKKS